MNRYTTENAASCEARPSTARVMIARNRTNRTQTWRFFCSFFCPTCEKIKLEDKFLPTWTNHRDVDELSLQYRMTFFTKCKHCFQQQTGWKIQTDLFRHIRGQNRHTTENAQSREARPSTARVMIARGRTKFANARLQLEAETCCHLTPTTDSLI